MKRILSTNIALLFLLLASAEAFAQGVVPSTTENYIYVLEPFNGNPVADGESPGIHTVQYFDGLGRPKQTIQASATPDHKDIVTRYSYDGFGRQSHDYLPAPAQQSGGQYIPDPTSAYTGYYTYAPYQTTVYYSEKEFEDSPLNRVLKQAAPGSDWALGSGHEIKFDYKFNTTTDQVLIFHIDTNGNLVKRKDINADGVAEACYLDGRLYKTVTTDENGHVLQEFKDKQGRVLLKRSFVSNGSVAGKTTDPGAELQVRVDTYYVYDIYGNLTYVIPPLLSEHYSGTGNLPSDWGTRMDNLGYVYRYDHRNRLIEKKLPGKGWEYLVYDKQDRLVATQDANQRNDGGKWLFTKYDKFGRVVYTGIYAGGTDRAAVQNAANAAAGNNNESRTTSYFTQNGISVRYTKTAFPTSFSDVLTVTYYDHYETGLNFTPGSFTLQPVRSGVENADSQNSLKGMAVTTLTRILGSTNWEKVHSVYDKKSRLVGSYKENHLGGFTRVESKLNFRGLPEYTLTNHKRTNRGIEVAIREDFTYDHMERPVRHTHKINNGATELIALNSYDALGKLENKKVGSTDLTGANRLQQVDYSYNIRGWLTSINDIGPMLMGKNTVPPGMGDDLFAFSIHYNTLANGGSAITEPLYNGNISQAFWKTSEDNITRGYHYTYDQLNRLRKADFYKQGNTNITAYGEYLAYDVNGNILALNRSMGDATDNEIDMDKLEYTYEGGNHNSNRLIKVVDNATTGKSHGFDNGTSGTSNDYTYDANGNMISDNNKAITSITYNHLNLPQLIVFDNYNSIEYIYNATGQKVQKKVTDGTTLKIVDYLDGFQYAGAILQFFPHGEGYVSVTTAGMSLDGSPNAYYYNYVFNYTDHLGNIRLSYTKDPSTNQLKILEENNYYPFGLKHSIYNSGKMDFTEDPEGGGGTIITHVRQTDYQYKYNGKEWQDEISLNLYDYGARNYDPALGRWMNIDPLTEKTYAISPYVYTLNNPVYFIDPDGMLSQGFLDDLWEKSQGDETTWTNNGNGSFSNENGDTIESEEEPPVNFFGSNENQLFHDAFNNFEYKKGDGNFYVFGHSTDEYLLFTDKNNNRHEIRTAEDFNKIMSQLSPEWKKAMEEGKEVTVTLFSCNAASEEYTTNKGRKVSNKNTIADKISMLPNVTAVIAADGYVRYGSDGVEGVRRNDAIKGGFITIKKGERTHKRVMSVNSSTGIVTIKDKQKIKE